MVVVVMSGDDVVRYPACDLCEISGGALCASVSHQPPAACLARISR